MLRENREECHTLDDTKGACLPFDTPAHLLLPTFTPTLTSPLTSSPTLPYLPSHLLSYPPLPTLSPPLLPSLTNPLTSFYPPSSQSPPPLTFPSFSLHAGHLLTNITSLHHELQSDRTIAMAAAAELSRQYTVRTEQLERQVTYPPLTYLIYIPPAASHVDTLL